MMHDEITTGEIHRLLVRVDRELGEHREETREELKGIREHLRVLNGRTSANESAIAVNSTRLHSLSTARPVEALDGDLKEILDFARDLKGAVRFGKWAWGLLGGGVVVALIWAAVQYLT